MKRNDLADIFYTIVHDYDDEIIKEAKAELQLGLKIRYINQFILIRDWARRYEYGTIAERAQRALDRVYTA